MNMLSKAVLATAAIATVITASSARDQIKIVGSSTVYPFSSYVAEELGATTSFPTPVVESTGSGGGMKLFCAGHGMDTPDITNASRPMKEKEWKLCQENGVTDIVGAMIGYDGIAFAQSKENPEISLTRDQIMLAVAAKVPLDGKLVDNPYKKWNEIDASLPDREIIIYGPPTSSGTRDAFEELVMEHASVKSIAGYGKKKFMTIRQDGVYVPSGENDNLIVQKLERNKDAFGIFGYSFLAENADKVMAAKIDNKFPTPETIADASYPVSRSLYFYVKKSHLSEVKALKPYIDMFMSEKMISEKGILKTIGLIPMEKGLRAKVQTSVANLTPLTEQMVKAKAVIK
jgi:phosphate transport system substrate-binding protein